MGRRWMLVWGLAVPGLTSAAQGQIVEVRRPEEVDLSRAGGVKRATTLDEADGFCSLHRSIKVAERTLLNFYNSGLSQATAQLLRICVGEKKIFTVPLYFLAGADVPSLGDAKPEERALTSLVVPTGGAFNFQLTNANPLWTAGDYTSVAVAYQAGVRLNRLPTAADPAVSESVVSGDFDIGLRFQTGAWDLDDKSTADAGVLWVQAKVGVHLVSDRHLGLVFSPGAEDPSSLSVESGLEIEDRVSIKASWYKVLNNKGIAALRRDVVKIGFEFKPAKP
jgi:hypothetical protein